MDKSAMSFQNSGKLNVPHVLVLCQLFYPELVSTGQTLTELCEVLADRGIEVEVRCGMPTMVDTKTAVPRFIEYHGISINRLRGTRFRKSSLPGRLLNQTTYAASVFFSLLRKPPRGPILVLTNPPFLAIICSIMRYFGGRPYIYLIFDVYPDTAINLGIIKKNGLIARIWNWGNMVACRRASEIIVIGRCMRKVISSGMAKRWQDKVRMIHVWSDDRLIQPKVVDPLDSFRSRWNLGDKIVISYTGNMGLFHDMETIMDAARILNDNKEIIFLFVGEGQKKKLMQDYSEKWNLSNCRFHSYVERGDLNTLLNDTDIGLVSLLPGQTGLSVPSKLYGILAAGVPAIAVLPEVTETAQVIMENDCGYVVRPGDANQLADVIKKLAGDEDLRHATGKKGRRAIDDKYSLQKAAEQYHNMIVNLQ